MLLNYVLSELLNHPALGRQHSCSSPGENVERCQTRVFVSVGLGNKLLLQLAPEAGL